MKIEVNQLSADLTVAHPRIKKSDDLEVRVVLTNASQRKLRLNALLLNFATIVLKVRKPDGTLVSPGPPPLPPVDDGQSGRMDLSPGRSVTFVYKGAQYFGAPLLPGEYQVRFRYENTIAQHGDWTGTIETDWVPFEVCGLEYLIGEVPRTSHTLWIDVFRRARYESHTNEDIPNYPEIGIYEMTLPASEVQSLDNILNNPPFKSLPDHGGRISPGERSTRIWVITERETSQKMVGTREPVDPSLRRVIDRLDQIVTRVRSHPQQTLRIGLTQVTVNSTGELTATMSLSNNGIQTVTCRNPVSLLGAADGWLSVQTWPDKPSSNLRTEDLVTAKVNRVEDLRPPHGGQSDASVIEIPPKGSALFRIHASLQLKKAGAYVVRISYATFAQQISGRIPIIGEVLSRTSMVNVQVMNKADR